MAAERGEDLPPEAFLYVGRLVEEKGVDVLAEGYRRYRSRGRALAADRGRHRPRGPPPHRQRGRPHGGLRAAADLPDVFAQAECLVLLSRFEPWAVVVHEAAAAGLPVVCTWVRGPTRLVLDGYNGVVMTPGDAEALAVAWSASARPRPTSAGHGRGQSRSPCSTRPSAGPRTCCGASPALRSAAGLYLAPGPRA